MTTNSILSLFPLTDDQRSASTAGEVAVSVTAGAGSGKTRTLVGRYLALLESGRPLRSLLAITFTDKAAREMRNRIRAEITRWLEQCPAAERERWQEAFSALDAARISTIHSLCTIILRSHPVEAGLDPGFAVLDEAQSALWRARAVEAGLSWATTDPPVVPLFSLWSEARLRGLLTNLLEKRLDTTRVLSTLPADPLSGWAATLNQWFTVHLAAPAWPAALDTLAALSAQTESDKLELARREVLAHWSGAQQAHAAQDWDALHQTLLALRAAISTGGAKGNWLFDDLTAVREAMGALRAHFDEVVSGLVDNKKPCSWALDRQAAELLPLVRRLFEQTQAIYQGYKSEAQALDFDDLEHLAAQLLAGNAAVRARWQREINAILLVDEFQDTNQRQRDIVYALAGFAEARTRGGEEAEKKRGEEEVEKREFITSSSLFVVGDAKQSIYRFRGADVTVFRQVQADIKAAGGALINFDLTFRAHRQLVDLTNLLLAQIMTSVDDAGRPYDVPFTPLIAYHQQPRTKIQPPCLEFQLGLGENKETGRQAAAAGLADRLHQLQRSGQIEWQEVALLFRASTAFSIYEDALEQAGIPFVTIAGRGFYERPEIRDLLNALAALADPSDDLALAGLLRSPAIGLSDGAIYRLRWAESGGRRSFWPALHSQAALANLPEAERMQAEFARQLIAALHTQAGRVSVAQLLKAFLDATHYRAILRLAPGGERLRRNVDKLLADAHRSELVSIPAFLEYLAALSDVGVRESEAPTEAGGAVQLMTIHKAKGLEFPLVVLADAGYTGAARPAPFYLDQSLGLLLNPSGDDSQPAAFRLAAWREAEQEAAEERRLLYVAATRAMEKFIISGNVSMSTAKAHPGRLMFSGWLKQLAGVIGLAETQLPHLPTTAQIIPLAWADGAAACTVHPFTSASIQPLPPGPPSSAPDISPPDLLTPLTVAPGPELDAKLKERESDPPPRVWRVVPPTQYDVPAWVIGSLTHVALRHWLFPDNDTFVNFLRPFALEAGLTDPASIDTALQRVTHLLNRFQHHPLYAELAAAERHHQLPYALALNGQRVSGIIDLLYRAAPTAAWTIAEFKTDRLAEGVDLPAYARQQGYLQQVETYRQAVAQQLGAAPKILLVFLNVGQLVQMLRLD
jgi:ATP-dependent helicase/nuclease subunit A